MNIQVGSRVKIVRYSVSSPDNFMKMYFQKTGVVTKVIKGITGMKYFIDFDNKELNSHNSIDYFYLEEMELDIKGTRKRKLEKINENTI